MSLTYIQCQTHHLKLGHFGVWLAFRPFWPFANQPIPRHDGDEVPENEYFWLKKTSNMLVA